MSRIAALIDFLVCALPASAQTPTEAQFIAGTSLTPHSHERQSCKMRTASSACVGASA
jgi:hypothetical protein